MIPPGPHWVGTCLDTRYRLVRLIGSGARASVYEAQEEVAGRYVGRVALKLLIPEADGDLDAILQEVQAMAQLAHPGLVGYRSCNQVAEGRARGAVYIAMELASHSLEDLIRERGKAPPDEVAECIAAAAETLGYLHSRGAIHRDVKPANLLRVAEWWKLGDLGEAVAAHESAASAAQGSPAYAAPEAFEGVSSPATDVYSLGVTALEALTGALAHEGATEAEFVRNVLLQPACIPKGLLPPWRELLAAMLAREPDERPGIAEIKRTLVSGQSPARTGAAALTEVDRFRESVHDAVRDGFLSGAERTNLVRVARELGLSRETAAEVFDEVAARLGAPIVGTIPCAVAAELCTVSAGGDGSGWEVLARTPGDVPAFRDREFCLRAADLNDERLVRLLAQLAPTLRIARLELADSAITDEALGEISHLPHLTSLVLTRCSAITDEGIARLKILTGLRQLELRACRGIGDGALYDLRYLRELTALSLRGCSQLTGAGVLELQYLLNLRKLDLTDVAGVGDREILALEPILGLQELSLAGCARITDEGLKHCRRFHDLLSLDLSRCPVVTGETLGTLGSLRGLGAIDLSQCERVTDAGARSLARCHELTRVSLACCPRLSDECLAEMGRLTRLAALDLSGCSALTGAGLAYLDGLARLVHLDLSMCQRVGDAEVALLRALRGMHTLALRRCDRVTGAGIGALRELGELRQLDLWGCGGIDDDALHTLPGHTRLERLTLNRCRGVGDGGLEHVGLVAGLEELGLSGCKAVGDRGLFHLSSLAALRVLDLQHCARVTDAGLAYVATLPALTDLNITGLERITAIGVRRLAALTRLRHLTMVGCTRVTGPLEGLSRPGVTLTR